MLENRDAPAAGWTQITSAPNVGVSTASLLPNGDVLGRQGQANNNEVNSGNYLLTPDAQGNYASGTWSQAASMNVSRLFYPSNVLPNGDLFAFGGEYAGTGVDGNTAEIFDPQANSWSFTSSTFPQQIGGDDPTEVLPSGQVLVGSITSPATYLFTPATPGHADSWTFAGNRLHNDFSYEESWVLLPDGSVLSYDITGSWASQTFEAQRYVPGANGAVGQWVDASQTSGTLPLLNDVATGAELGPAVLLANGNVLQFGGNSHTALYSPSTNTWTAGPEFPQLPGGVLTMDDEPAAELPNGNVLLALSPAISGNFSNQGFSNHTYLYEYNAASNSFVQESTVSTLPTGLTQALTGTNGNGGVEAYNVHFLDLPNGHALLTLGKDSSVWDYTPDTTTAPASRPTVTSVTSNGDGSYTLNGTALTGFSEGAAYGDDAEMSTNYPIVQLTNVNDGTVWYANSFNWTPGVAEGAGSVEFAQPYNLPSATYSVSVIASGISSNSGSSPINISSIAHLYADTRWQDRATFSYIPDADPVTPGSQPGLIGVNCFASVDTVIFHALTGATVTVNGGDGSGNYGNFAEAVSVNKQIYLNLQGGPVSFNSLAAESDAHVILNGVTLTLTDNTDSTFAGSLINTGELSKTGTGTLTLSGTETGSGATNVGAGVVMVSGTITGSGGVTVSGAGSIRPTTATALAGTTVTVGVTGGLDLSALSAATLGGLAGSGGIDLDGKTLTVGADNVDTTYSGVFTGSGSLLKAGYGTTTVSGSNNDPAMGATVDAGALTATGTFTGNNSYVITVPAGGTFDGISPTAGSDSVDATVNVSGTFGAGTATAPGQLGVLDLDMAPSGATPGTFAARLYGTAPGTGNGAGYDQVDVFGPANIGGAALDLMPGAFNQFTSGTSFTLIQDAGNPITGTFAGLPNASVVSAAGNYFQIAYGIHATTLTAIDAPVATDQNGRARIQINDGSAQRSEVRSVSVTFSTVVTFVGDPGDAFQLEHVQDGATLNHLHGVTSLNGAGDTVVTLTFTTYENAPTEVDPISGEHGFSPSLADGRYQLKTGNYTSPADTSGGGTTQLGLFRLFGDADGNGVVDQLDLRTFSSAFNASTGNPYYLAYLDADNSGTIDQLDLDQFNARFNKTIF